MSSPTEGVFIVRNLLLLKFRVKINGVLEPITIRENVFQDQGQKGLDNWAFLLKTGNALLSPVWLTRDRTPTSNLFKQ